MRPTLEEGIAQLTRVYPLITSVRVKRVPKLIVDGRRCDAHVWWIDGPRGTPNRFHIEIDAGLGRGRALDALAHEWAHCIRWTEVEHGVEAPHSDAWGRAYARCYRLFFDEETA